MKGAPKKPYYRYRRGTTSPNPKTNKKVRSMSEKELNKLLQRIPNLGNGSRSIDDAKRVLAARKIIRELRKAHPNLIDPVDKRVHTTVEEYPSEAIMEATLLLMEASQTHAREAGVKQLPEKSYSFLSKAARPWMDMTTGGLSKLGREDFQFQLFFIENKKRFKVAEAGHKEHCKLRHRVHAVIHRGAPATEETQRYYDEKSKELTERGNKVFTKSIFYDFPDNKAASLLEMNWKARATLALKEKWRDTVKSASIITIALSFLAALVGDFRGSVVEYIAHDVFDKIKAVFSNEPAPEIREIKKTKDAHLTIALHDIWRELQQEVEPEGAKIRETFGAKAENQARKVLSESNHPDEIILLLRTVAPQGNRDEILGTLVAWQASENERVINQGTPSTFPEKEKSILREVLVDCVLKPQEMPRIQAKLLLALNPTKPAPSMQTPTIEKAPQIVPNKPVDPKPQVKAPATTIVAPAVKGPTVEGLW